MSLRRKFLFNLRYFQKPPWDTGISPPELFEYIESNPPGRALDLGCGTCTNSITLAKHGWNVTGVDFAYRAIWSGRKKARRAGVTVDLRVDDVTHLYDINGVFNLILDIGCFHSLSDKGKLDYINNLLEFLSVDGRFLLYAFFKNPSENGSGLVDADLIHLSNSLSLINRKDGTERGLKPSSWLTYQRIRQTE